MDKQDKPVLELIILDAGHEKKLSELKGPFDYGFIVDSASDHLDAIAEHGANRSFGVLRPLDDRVGYELRFHIEHDKRPGYEQVMQTQGGGLLKQSLQFLLSMLASRLEDNGQSGMVLAVRERDKATVKEAFESHGYQVNVY